MATHSMANNSYYQSGHGGECESCDGGNPGIRKITLLSVLLLGAAIAFFMVVISRDEGELDDPLSFMNAVAPLILGAYFLTEYGGCLYCETRGRCLLPCARFFAFASVLWWLPVWIISVFYADKFYSVHPDDLWVRSLVGFSFVMASMLGVIAYLLVFYSIECHLQDVAKEKKKGEGEMDLAPTSDPATRATELRALEAAHEEDRMAMEEYSKAKAAVIAKTTGGASANVDGSGSADVLVVTTATAVERKEAPPVQE